MYEDTFSNICLEKFSLSVAPHSPLDSSIIIEQKRNQWEVFIIVRARPRYRYVFMNRLASNGIESGRP